MSEAIDDMKAYSLLNDGVIHRILESKSSDLEESRTILQRVLRRDLYKFVGEERFSHKTFKDENEVKEDMDSVTDVIDDKHILIDLVNLNYGKKDMNPIDFVNFYTKDKPDEAEPRQKDDVSLLLPKEFAEQLVRIYCKNMEFYTDVKERFNNWSKNTNKRAKEQKTDK